jgi:hypothetical protein
VLVGLDLPEVVTIPLIKPVLAVDLEPATVHDVVVPERLSEARLDGGVRQLRDADDAYG